MFAMSYDHYGPAETVQLSTQPRPEPRPDEILVRVNHSTVTTADWRMRASAFPGGLWLLGRLMFGLFGPRNKILGGEFAGRVVAAGKQVQSFAPGDLVFGFAGQGAHAEYLTIKATGCVAPLPDGLPTEAAAALPFGGLSALLFLRDFAKLQSGEKILIAGASGGVGVYMVQIAKAMGADVTAVAGSGNMDLLRDLGAHRVIDYRQQKLSAAGRDYDLVIDPAGYVDYAQARTLLKPEGRFVALNFGCRELGQLLLSKLRSGPRMIIGVNGDSQADLLTLRSMVEAGQVRPVIGHRFELSDIRDAYRLVESRHRRGAVVLDNSFPNWSENAA